MIRAERDNLANMYLILGKMPADATPQTHIAAGPWCFTGQEEIFPGWEKNFIFSPEPLANSSLLPQAASAAMTLAVAKIPELAKLLSPDWNQFSEKYWETLLFPWALNVAKQIVERCLRIQAMREKFADQDLVVPLLPEDMDFNFLDEQDFTLRGTLGTNYNHWLLSRILVNRMPENWRTEVPERRPLLEKHPGTQKNLIGKFRDIIKNISLKLPFPRLKGMTAWQTLRFSIAVSHPCASKDSATGSRSYMDLESLKNIPLPEDIDSIFIKSLPQSLKRLKHIPEKKISKKPRLRIASIAAYENAAYRQTLAYWRGRGNRLAYVQHGGNYGQVRVACDTALVEYSQSTFFTWGWEKHGDYPGNFIPVPYPQIQKLKDAWKGSGSKDILFVGTEMAAYGYRLDSRPTPMQFIAYRDAKAAFLNALHPGLVANTLYRPYFPIPGTFADADWLLPFFPALRLCKGDIYKQMMSSRLLVIDHPGTTMLEALAMNIPFVLYWNRKHWPLTDEADEFLSLLEKHKIWHPEPESAADFINAIWSRVDEWWQEDKIQAAREEYGRNYALYSDAKIEKIWTTVLRKL